MRWTPRVNKSVAVLSGLVMTAGLSSSIAATQTGSPSTQVVSMAARDCPKHALRLPGNGVARAAQEALDEAAFRYKGLNTRHARVQKADRSAFAGVRGKQVRRQCGAKAARRTVVVQLKFPKVRGSASLSQGVVFVARFPRGYRAWDIAH